MRTGRLDTILPLIVGVIIIFGLIALSSASTVVGYERHGDSAFFLKRQLLSVLIGVLFFALTYSIDYRRWKRFALGFLIVSIILLLGVFAPGLGREFLGARRWISLGPLIFQPSEIIKLSFLVYLAAWFEQRGFKIRERAYGLWPFLAVLSTVVLLVSAQPDLGTVAVISVAALTSFLIAGATIQDITLTIVLGVTAGAILIKASAYRAARFLVFLNPQLDPQGIGYHINQALLAIGSGGLFGLGLGHSRQKFNYLPEVEGDSIFAVISEELGLFVELFLISLYVIFLVRGYRIARSAPDEFGRILATGITSWIGFQALINMAALTGVIPLTGVPLPFVSYGGTAMIVSCAAVGVLANISRTRRAYG